MRAVLLGGTISLVLSLFGTRLAIRQFTIWGFGQEIRKDGPTTHHVKRGTPTMGGCAMVLSVVLGYGAAKLLTREAPSSSALLLLLLFVGMAVVGFLDDFIKIRRQRSLGLRSRAKIVGQALVALAFGVPALRGATSGDGTAPVSDRLSFVRDVGPELPWILLLGVIWLMVTGTSNATNLTDGADGLLAGSASVVFAGYTIIGIWENNHHCSGSALGNATCYQGAAPLDLATVAAAMTGACIGFLWWNASPARIIMGDTGSLALGAAMAGLALMTRTELLLVVLGGLFVAVTCSVMLQVSWFKVTRRATGVGRRLFLMAPLQHHFEQLGWREVTVCVRFWIVAGLCVTAGLGIFYSEWLTTI
ncbi:MAG: phospho-N-acetylmuramoyl-pentapeptide-transferase [Nocardioidaceae bacterium]|nr:phospho-N-acetylmuramoyl-pentapeptide-transferase [Nocardioidaceae bacterium]NUS51322.1 phospho-N-acetylmuramoyl-pentapeptide-transferase [Nocardioidaceae bacterium]